MRPNETKLEMVQRHVRDGKFHVARQLSIVAAFHATGRPVEVAERTLSNIQAAQREHEAHLLRLTTKLVAVMLNKPLS